MFAACLTTPPVPEIEPAKVWASERLKTSVPLVTTLPAIEPAVPPAPTASVPPEMMVLPV